MFLSFFFYVRKLKRLITCLQSGIWRPIFSHFKIVYSWCSTQIKILILFKHTSWHNTIYLQKKKEKSLFCYFGCAYRYMDKFTKHSTAVSGGWWIFLCGGKLQLQNRHNSKCNQTCNKLCHASVCIKQMKIIQSNYNVT